MSPSNFRADLSKPRPRWYAHECPHGPHRGPEGPEEDIMGCFTCGFPYATRRAGYPGGPTDAWKRIRRQARQHPVQHHDHPPRPH